MNVSYVTLVPFETRHLAVMDLGQSDRRALAGQSIHETGIAFTLYDGDAILGCGGLVPVGDHAEAWVVMSGELRDRPMVFHRVVKRVLAIQKVTWPVPIRALARCDFKGAQIWLERLGFVRSGEIERDGTTFADYMLARP